MKCAKILPSLLLLITSLPVLAGANTGLHGVVRDQKGNLIAGAEVVALAGGKDFHTRSGLDGSFAFPELGATTAHLRATEGLRSGEASVDLTKHSSVELVLALWGRSETVSVTATRFLVPREATPELRHLPEEAIADTPALSLDEVLRQIPSFTLFRRTPGWSANPTAQGVSLRGLGASGASRALVLADGVPMNDPFGGWVYWNRVPRTELEAIEAAVGPESDVYGTDALGGAIQLLRRSVQDKFLSIDSSFSNLVTPNGSASGGLRMRAWTLEGAVQGVRTNGYVPVRPEDRGAVDTVVRSEWTGADATVERMIGQRGEVYLRGNYYAEARQNGTPLQTNNANIRELTLGSEWATGGGGRLSVRMFGGSEQLGQSFTAIAVDRNLEVLTRLQRVPVEQIGGTAEWSGTVRGQTMYLGTDVRHIEGESDETAFALGIPSAALRSGGTENLYGVTGQAYLHPHPRVLVSVGARVDHWTNTSGFSSNLPLATKIGTVVRFADRDQTAFSPKIGMQVRLTDRVRLFGSASNAFRAPTLNELYRSFRVGNVLTMANATLKPEKLRGYEAGLRVRAGKHGMLQSSWFWNRINGPVANVTQTTTPALITRQRQNLGQTRSRGIDTRFELTVNKSLSMSVGYLYAKATVTDFPGTPSLVGLWIPQVPRHTATAQVRLSRMKLGTLALQARYQGQQFDDDQNQFPLAGYFTLDLFAAHTLRPGVEVYVGAENMFDRRYEVGRTPVLTIGPPAMAKVGIRWTLGDTAH